MFTSSQTQRFRYGFVSHKLNNMYKMSKLTYTPNFEDFGHSVART